MSGLMRHVTEYSYSKLKPYLKEPVLELGPADGVVTEMMMLDDVYPDLVEGSQVLTNSLKRKFPQLSIVESLFEEYIPEKKYTTIVMGHVLEHVENPIQILQKFSNFLTEDGLIWASVPNALSIHRKAAVKMGLLDTPYQLNEADIQLGHRRVFDLDAFYELFNSAGLKVINSGGYLLKPLSYAQMEKDWSAEMVLAFIKLGEENIEQAAEIWIAAKI
jgi:trans-aconitate methyltransferase